MLKLPPKAGDLFSVPQTDTGYCIGQILAFEPRMLNSVSCILTDTRDIDFSGSPPMDRIVASVFTTPDLLKKGRCKIVGTADISLPRHLFPYEHLRSASWVGAKLVGSANIESLLNACFGLQPWDDWADRDYLTKLLFAGRCVPAAATFSREP